MTFAVTRKEGLQQKAAGEVIFHQKRPQRHAPLRGLTDWRPRRGTQILTRATESGHEPSDVGLIAGARVSNQIAHTVGGTQQHADCVRTEHHLPGADQSQYVFCLVRQRADLDKLQRAGSSSDLMNRLEDTIYAVLIDSPAAAFESDQVRLHALGVLTRIETARLGAVGADFGSLADDVNLLASHVQSKVQSALETAAVLLPSIESALRHISGIEETQASSLPSVISGVIASLSTFRSLCDSQEKMHASSARLAAQYAAILQAFKKMIVSIQFHDLTRQQVEHVIEVLRRLCSESEGGKGDATVLAIQSSQLADAGEKFAASVASVERNLAGIAVLVLEMANESRTMSGRSEEEKNSFFSQLEGGCALLFEGLKHCAATEAATRTTSSRLREEIGGMRDSVEEILAIEIQMQRMALNAGIRAAHIGPSGDALGVLAGSMQQQAFESRDRSTSLSEALASMREAAVHLSGPPATEGGGQDSYLEGVRTAVAELHASSERTFVQLAEIVIRGSRLREDLSAARENFTVGALFADAVSRARGMLMEIGKKYPIGLPHGGGETSDAGLTDFSQQYTMQSEHDVHQGATKAAIVAATTMPVEQSESPPNDAEEVGRM